MIFIVFAFSFSILSCSKNYDAGIYRTGRVWNFSVYFLDRQNHITDSCSLQMTIGKGGILSYAAHQRQLLYTYGNCCGKNLKETTGVDERANYIFIHPPRLGCFAFTEIPPMPEINLPVNMNTVNNGELTITKAEYSGLDGKTIKQKDGPVKKEFFKFADTSVNCVLIAGENTNYLNELGLYKSEYLFNEYYGFVQMIYYKPNGEVVKFVLKSTNFK